MNSYTLNAAVLLAMVGVLVTCHVSADLRDQSTRDEPAGASKDVPNAQHGSVKQCLDRIGLKLAHAVYQEEPPGQLCALTFYNSDGGWIELRLSANSYVYSTDGIWDAADVLRAPVAEIMDDKRLERIHLRILEGMHDK